MERNFKTIKIGDRLYRYSLERRTSERPLVIEYDRDNVGSEPVWCPVRNQDKIDAIWAVADRDLFS